MKKYKRDQDTLITVTSILLEGSVFVNFMLCSVQHCNMHWFLLLLEQKELCNMLPTITLKKLDKDSNKKFKIDILKTSKTNRGNKNVTQYEWISYHFNVFVLCRE